MQTKSSFSQRKGQWLWNQISMSYYAKNREENALKFETILYNLSDEEFDKIMEKRV